MCLGRDSLTKGEFHEWAPAVPYPSSTYEVLYLAMP
jgi:hypothetical protein